MILQSRNLPVPASFPPTFTPNPPAITGNLKQTTCCAPESGRPTRRSASELTSPGCCTSATPGELIQRFPTAHGQRPKPRSAPDISVGYMYPLLRPLRCRPPLSRQSTFRSPGDFVRGTRQPRRQPGLRPGSGVVAVSAWLPAAAVSAVQSQYGSGNRRSDVRSTGSRPRNAVRWALVGRDPGPPREPRRSQPVLTCGEPSTGVGGVRHGVAIPRPIPDVADHVVEAELVRLQRPDRRDAGQAVVAGRAGCRCRAARAPERRRCSTAHQARPASRPR